MNDFKSRAAALKPYIEKPWSEFSDEVRQLAVGPFSLLAGTNDLPPTERIAIIGNTTTKGIWQYSIESSWINIPAGLSDTNAIVIQKGQSGVALRFEAALVGRVSVCFDPPEPLTVRVWEGDGTCEVPEPGTHDISQNIGKAGQWSAETFSIVVDDAGRPKSLTTVGAVWDRLSADQRRAVAHLWDVKHHPASEVEQERAFALVAKASDLENYIAALEREPPTSIEGMVLKRAELKECGKALDQVKAELKKACAGRPHNHQPRGARVSKPRQADVNAWYQQRVAAHDPAQPSPSRVDDQKAAREQFKVGGLKDMVRLARRTHAPVAWTQPGSKGRKLRQHASSRSEAK